MIRIRGEGFDNSFLPSHICLSNLRRTRQGMEKYSRFRDAGTGIQVFLTPVPPASSSSALQSFTLPLQFLLGALRTILIVFLALLWTILSLTLGSLNRSISSGIIATFGRSILFVLGFSWIKTEVVSLRSRGRASASIANDHSRFSPSKGDIILSNFSSWIDVLYLAIKFNPTFVSPIVSPNPNSSTSSTSTPVKASPSRSRSSRTVSDGPPQSYLPPAGTASPERVLGWRKISMLGMILRSGSTPIVKDENDSGEVVSLDKVLQRSSGPVVVFPEFVTSNGRGLLRAGPVFPATWINHYKEQGSLRLGSKNKTKIFLMSIKHDPPTSTSSTSTHSVPTSFNPLPHLWSLASSLSLFRSLTIRLLDESETPTSKSFQSDVSVSDNDHPDPLADACMALIAKVSRLRRTNLGWEDKESFLKLVEGRR